jgi:P-type Ca2+ transporter type 2C
VPPPSGDAHHQDVDEVLRALEVDADTGLNDREVVQRRGRHGPNRLAEPETTPWWRLLSGQLANTVVMLLVAAAGVGLLIGEVIEAAAIGIVLMVNTIVGFLTELQAARSMAALRQMLHTVAEVERDNRRDEIDAVDLVPGDIVGIEAGEQVPADIRLIEAEDLKIEEAGLTGESEPVDKDTDPVPLESPLGDRTCMAFMGTTVVAGRGRGVVVATGPSSQMGQVAELVESAEQGRAPLQEGLDRLSRRLAVLVVAGAAVLVGIGWLRGQPLAEIAEVAVALAIAVVPEGLPAVATLTLAVGMRRMAAENALVRRLRAVETLGSTTVVCSDKTGTLTLNQMSVVDAVLADDLGHRELWVTATWCNDADVARDGDPVGDPTEVALLQAASAHEVDWRALREAHDRDREVPFSAQAKRMAVVVDGIVHVKGAPEVLLDPARHPKMIAQAERLADKALRVLAIARRDDPGAQAPDDALFEDLEILGLVGLHDPPRATAVGAIQALHAAGIRTVMITGDRPDTARAIAAEMDVSHGGVITGTALAAMRRDELAEAARSIDVFARVDPAHKLQIIEALQQAGEVVAVTGDGINDAPALRQGDVGVAMGGGTDVAKEAADIILLDDELGTLEAAVEEGRRIFTNVRRFAQFLFSWHVAEVAVITTAVVVGFPAPLAGLMILWNNLVIDVLPSFALALEPSRGDVMRQPPRDPQEPVIDNPTVRRILTQASLVAAVGLTAYATGTAWLGLETRGAQTMTFIAMSAGRYSPYSTPAASTAPGSGARPRTDGYGSRLGSPGCSKPSR